MIKYLGLFTIAFLCIQASCESTQERECPPFYFDIDNEWREFVPGEVFVFVSENQDTFRLQLDSISIFEGGVMKGDGHASQDVLCYLYANYFYDSPSLEEKFLVHFNHREWDYYDFEDETVGLTYHYYEYTRDSILISAQTHNSVRLHPPGALGSTIPFTSLAIDNLVFNEVVKLEMRQPVEEPVATQVNFDTLWVQKGIGLLQVQLGGRKYQRINL